MKKTYKNSRLGLTAYKSEGSNDYCYIIDNTDDRDPDWFIPKQMIEGSPDWVEEKDFVITAFRLLGGGILIRNQAGNFQSRKCDYPIQSEDSLLISKEEIFSVLCNGIEWKIGDQTNMGEIRKFEIFTNEMNAFFQVGGWINITELTPAKKVILTTEDNCEIYDSEQSVYYVRLEDFFFNPDSCKIKVGALSGEYDYLYKYFNSVSNAESYISQNKKKFSENDIRDILIKNFNKELVQSLLTKLNEK